MLIQHLTWRDTYLALAGVLLVVTVPLHAFALNLPWAPPPADEAFDGRAARGAEDATAVGDAAVRSVLRSPAFWLLSTALTVTAFGL